MKQLRKPDPAGECNLMLVESGMGRLQAIVLEVERGISSLVLRSSVGWPSGEARMAGPSRGDLQLSDSHGHEIKVKIRWWMLCSV